LFGWSMIAQSGAEPAIEIKIDGVDSNV
jgi:hypothetical protein